jgi:hypothetical protein
MRRFRLTTVLAILAVALGALPALADEADEADEAEATEFSQEHSPIVAALVAFGMTQDEVAALRDLGLGFGDIFKLKTLSLALNDGQTLADLVADIGVLDPVTGEYEVDWRALKLTLTSEQLAALDGFPKNLGAIVSAARRHHGHEEHQPEHAGFHGKPASAGHGGKHGGG